MMRVGIAMELIDTLLRARFSVAECHFRRRGQVQALAQHESSV
jgi:hypothetical protein